MMQGLLGLLDSKKAFAGGLLVIGATVLCAIGKMTVADWQSYTQTIFMVWAGAETANGVAATIKGHGQVKKETAPVTTTEKKHEKKE
jgi:hypothetical protein